MNKLLSIYLEGGFHNWEGCGLCMHNLDVAIQNKYLWRSTEPRRRCRIRDIKKNIKNIILENICEDLGRITSEDLLSLVRVKKFRRILNTRVDKDFDLFYSDIGYFLWGMVIVFLDNHMQDRIRLHNLLEDSLARSYLIRMEKHSGDFGSQKIS